MSVSVSYENDGRTEPSRRRKLYSVLKMIFVGTRKHSFLDLNFMRRFRCRSNGRGVRACELDHSGWGGHQALEVLKSVGLHLLVTEVASVSDGRGQKEIQ